MNRQQQYEEYIRKREDRIEAEKRKERKEFKKYHPYETLPDHLKRDHQYSNNVKEDLMPW